MKEKYLQFGLYNIFLHFHPALLQFHIYPPEPNDGDTEKEIKCKRTSGRVMLILRAICLKT